MRKSFLLVLPVSIMVSAVLLFMTSCTEPTSPGLKTVTKDSHVACYKKMWMEEVLEFIRTKNKAKFTHYIQGKRCIYMIGGLDVKLTEPPGIFGSISGFKLGGVKYWTSKDSLLYDQ